MRKNVILAAAIVAGIGLGGLGGAASAFAQTNPPAVSTNPTNGNVTVTLSDGTQVLIPAALAAQVVAAMSSTNPTTVEQAIAQIVSTNAANNANLATAIYVLAASTTNNAALLAAAYAGTVAGNSGAATELAANAGSPTGGAPAGGGGPGGTVVAGTGGTSGSGPVPSSSTP
jgi:hypothetical protein